MRSMKNKIGIYILVFWLISIFFVLLLVFFTYRASFLQFIEGASGNFSIIFHDGNGQRTYLLDDNTVLQLFWVDNKEKLLLIVIIAIFLIAGTLYFASNVLDAIFKETASIFKHKQTNQTTYKEFFEIQKLIQHYQADIIELEKKNQEFRRYASHELRNELATMRGYYDFYQVDHIKIRQQQQILENTINDLIILSYNQHQTPYETINPLLIVSQAVDAFSKVGTITLHYDETINWQNILGKENWLYRAYCNLLDNALRYQEQSSVVRVELQQVDGYFMTKIINTVPAGFEYADFTKTKRHGIGLNLVEHIATILAGAYYYEITDQQVISTISIPILAKSG